MTLNFIWIFLGTIPTTLEIYAPLPSLPSLILCRNLDPNMCQRMIIKILSQVIQLSLQGLQTFLVTYDVRRAREIMWSWTEWQRMTVPPQISGISRSLALTAAVIMSPFLTVIVRYTRWRQCSATFEHQLYKAEQRWLLQGGDRLTRKSGIEICLTVRVCNYLPICGECAAISQIHEIWSLVQGHTWLR